MEEVAAEVLTDIVLKQLLEEFLGGGESGDEALYDMVRTQIEMSSNGEADNDTELLLEEIKNSLQYNEDYTALQEISARLEVIDTRLDREFVALNNGLAVIGSVLLAWASMRFMSWMWRYVTG